jgi:hypothetical protein
LCALAKSVRRLSVTRKVDLQPGDWVVVTTKNSVYRLQALGGNLFHAFGGWFDRFTEPSVVTINGCTFGGSAICTDIVAANGLFLEFGNSVSTTRIRDVRVIRMSGAQEPLPN